MFNGFGASAAARVSTLRASKAFGFAALIALGASWSTGAMAASGYSVVDLVVLPLASSQTVRAINNKNEVAGGAATTALPHRAFVLSRSGLARIEPVAGSDYSTARGINDLGEVVGTANTATSVQGFRWTKQGGARLLPPLAGDSASEAFDVNLEGQAVGFSSGKQGIRAVLWTRSGAVQELGGFPAGVYSRALSINRHGDIAGTYGKAPAAQAFLRTRAKVLQELRPLPGDVESEAVGVNDGGEVVGWSKGPDGTRAVLWSGGAALALGSLRAGQHSRGRAINARGEVVGDSGSAHDSRAFRWTRTEGLQDLNAFLPHGAGFVLLEAVAINDAGVIVALGRDYDHSNHDHSKHGRADPVRVFLLVPAR